MMKDYDQSVKINHNPNWLYIPDHPFRTLIIGGSGSIKTNVLLNLIKKLKKFIYMSKIHSNQSINYLLMEEKKQEFKNEKNSKVRIDYSQAVDDVYENLEDYNPMKNRKVLIVFDEMKADMESSKKSRLIVTELFLRGRKLDISLLFISQLYFKVPKTIRLKGTHYFIIKIPNK